MFWGLRLEPGKRYSTTVDRSFHISMAALDCSSVKSDNEVLSVLLDEVETNGSFILCNLQKNKLMQSPLNLNFMTGDRLTIYCKGNGVVHLSGYLAEDDELEQLGEEDDDEVEDEGDELSENEELQVTKGKGKLNGFQAKRKIDELKSPQPKKKKTDKIDEDSDDSDDEDDDMANDDIEDESMGLEGEESDDDDDDEDDDDDDDDDDEEEEEDEDESDEENKMPSKPQQPVKKNKKNKLQGQQQQQGPNKQQNTPNLNKQQNQQNTPNLNKQQNQQNTPSLNKQQNKGKQQQKTPNGLSPEAQVKKDKKKGDKTPGGTPGSNVKLNKSTDESPNAKKGGEPHAKKTLDGGVMVKDLKVGNGPICKAGKMACVYYIGRFKQNNKEFDSTKEGPGFKFRVGKGEVIKGWDLGVVGMKVGGKRLITCPPHMAYGQKGSPPTIPPNSSLVFEVELKSVN